MKLRGIESPEPMGVNKSKHFGERKEGKKRKSKTDLSAAVP
jgi:hypothetical protein